MKKIETLEDFKAFVRKNHITLPWLTRGARIIKFKDQTYCILQEGDKVRIFVPGELYEDIQY